MRSAVIPMSTRDVRWICSTIDAIGCGIVRKVYIGRPARQPDAMRVGRARDGVATRDRRAISASGAQLGEARVVGQPLAGNGTQPLASRGVVVEPRDPAE